MSSSRNLFAQRAVDCVQPAAAVGPGSLLPAGEVDSLRTLNPRAAAGCVAHSGSGLPQSTGFARTTLLHLLLLALPLQAEWNLSSETQPESLGQGAWFAKKVLVGPAGVDLELSLVFFDARTAKIAIAAQTTLDCAKAKTLGEMAVITNAIAACNGGYFTPEFGPSGLELAQGVRTGSWLAGRPLGGVLFVRNGRPSLALDSEFHDDASITDLVQCSPMLVQNGRAVSGIGATDRVARTFAGTDGGDRWVIGFCKRSGLEELASALVSSAAMGGFKLQTALNLDGGPSSGLWWKPANAGPQAIRATTRVRNVVLILPK